MKFKLLLDFEEKHEFPDGKEKRCGASDKIVDFSVLSNPVIVRTFSCLGLNGWNNCPKSNVYYRLSTFSPQFLVSI